MATKVAAQAKTRKHTLGCTADIWDQGPPDQLLLGCAGGACGSVDLQLLDLTPDSVLRPLAQALLHVSLSVASFSKSEIAMLDLFRIRRMWSM